MSWEALGHDPVPGDVDAVLRVASVLGSIGDQAEVIGRRLRAIGDGTGASIWRGDAAEAFRRQLDEIGPEVMRLTGSHRAAQDAMQAYAVVLADAQANARLAETRAAGGIADRTLAARHRDTAAVEAATHTAQARAEWLAVQKARGLQLTATAIGDPSWHAELVTYERRRAAQQHHAEGRAAQARGREQAAATAESQAHARIVAAQALGRQAAELRESGAHQAVQRLDAAGRPALAAQNPVVALFKKFNDALRDIATNPTFLGWLDAIDDASTVLTIIGFVALLIPGGQAIGIALLTVAKLLDIATLAGTLLAVPYGKKNATDLAWAVAGVVPGLKLAKGVKPGVRGTLGVIKRALYYGDARKARILRGIPVAPKLPGFDKPLVKTFPIIPQLYYAGRGIIKVIDGVKTVHEGVRIGRSVIEFGPRVLKSVLVPVTPLGPLLEPLVRSSRPVVDPLLRALPVPDPVLHPMPEAGPYPPAPSCPAEESLR